MATLVNESMASAPTTGTLVHNNGTHAIWNAGGWYQLTNSTGTYADLEYTGTPVSPFTVSVGMQSTPTGGADSIWLYYGCSTTPQQEDNTTGIGYLIERNDFSNTIAIRYGGTTLTSVAWTPDANFDTLQVAVTGQAFTVTYKGSTVISYTDTTTRTLPGTKYGFGARTGYPGTVPTHNVQNLLVTDSSGATAPNSGFLAFM